MKILFVLENYFPEHAAGTEQYVFNLISGLKHKEHTIEILITSSNPDSSDYEYKGTKVYVIPIKEKASRKELSGISPPENLDDFINRVAEINPDIVHFHSFGRAINSYHLKWVHENGCKSVFTPHLSSVFCLKGNLHYLKQAECDGRVLESRCLYCHYRNKGINTLISRLLSMSIPLIPDFLRPFIAPQINIAKHRKKELERINKHADAVISIAPWIQKTFARNNISGNVKLVEQAVPDGSILESSNPQGTQSLKGKSVLRFAYIGRMHPIKGFSVLRKALDRISSLEYSLSVYTHSSEVEHDFLSSQKEWCRNKPNIEWIEDLSHQELMSRMSMTDLVIVPSYSEMAPLVIMEAFQYKVPVLGSSIAAIRDMVADGVNGRIFLYNDPADLAGKLEEIIADPGLLKEWGKHITPPRTFRDLASEMEQIYNKLIS